MINISDEGLVSRTHKEFSQLKKNKTLEGG